MNKQAAKDLVYGGLLELVTNKQFYYTSSISPAEYSHFTDEGKDALIEYMNAMAFVMQQTEAADLDKRAKDMVIKSMKGEK
jgi:hypothetical protein